MDTTGFVLMMVWVAAMALLPFAGLVWWLAYQCRVDRARAERQADNQAYFRDLAQIYRERARVRQRPNPLAPGFAYTSSESDVVPDQRERGAGVVAAP